MAEISPVLIADRSIAVVGASGFIGRALADEMASRNASGVAISRSPYAGGMLWRQVRDYADVAAMRVALKGCTSAIVLAGRAHVLYEKAADPEAEFLSANREVPLSIAEALAAAGGGRLVFVSSLAVLGVATGGRVLDECSNPAPVTAYGRSKLAGERALTERCRALGLELVIVRPPMVYGLGAPGQYGRLQRAARRGLPLPLAGIANARDMIGIENLVDVLLLIAKHPAAPGETFLVSDGQAVSTGTLAHWMYSMTGREARLWQAPASLWHLLRTIPPLRSSIDRLTQDLRIDGGHVTRLLGWRPPLSPAEGVWRSMQWSSER